MTVVTEKVRDTYETLLTNPNVQEGLRFIKDEDANTLADQIAITTIPAPTFLEAERGVDYKRRLEELGLQHLVTDRVGNVFGLRKGTGNGPTVFVSAHLDTVFPEGTAITPTIKNGLVYAPGISDDGRGLTAVLTLLKTLNHLNIQTVGDLIIGATVGEEGLGDLNGVKAFFADHQHIDGFISIEPGPPTGITYLAAGSHRYKVTFRGPGGHSFGNFGIPSPIHALGRAVSMIADVQVPVSPKTTFNVGVISGGTSVNTIAEEASFILDMRSVSNEELLKMEEQILSAVQRAVEFENERWDKGELITVEVKQVGDRPAGSQPPESTIVQVAQAATRALGFTPVLEGPSSTDSNVPISLGIPAVTLGGGGSCGGVHTLDEYFDPTDAFTGIQQIFLTILGLVGLTEVTEPLLEKK